MYQIGDYIVYSGSGVCHVEAIGSPPVCSAGESRRYYTLVPVYGMETIYIPVDTKAFMRPVITREEARALVDQIPAIPADAVKFKSLQMLSEYYQASFRSHDCGDLVHLIKTIYRRGRDAERAGKKPSVIDQRYRKRAEDLLHGELAVALGIAREAVPDYIKERIEGNALGS